MSDLLSDNKIGFRRGFRTSDHVFTLKTVINKSRSENNKLYLCFVDFRKAYDTVWRKGFFYKLLKQGVGNKFVKVIMSMYKTPKLSVSVPENITHSFNSFVGLKQGCHLIPILFNLFINDF